MGFSKYEFRVALWQLIESHLAKGESAETHVEIDAELEEAAYRLNQRGLQKIPDEDFDNLDLP